MGTPAGQWFQSVVVPGTNSSTWWPNGHQLGPLLVEFLAPALTCFVQHSVSRMDRWVWMFSHWKWCSRQQWLICVGIRWGCHHSRASFQLSNTMSDTLSRWGGCQPSRASEKYAQTGHQWRNTCFPQTVGHEWSALQFNTWVHARSYINTLFEGDGSHVHFQIYFSDKVAPN